MVTYSPEDVIVELIAVTNKIWLLEDEQSEMAKLARQAGATWTQIGDAMGITKQAAWERFSQRAQTTSAPVDQMQLTVSP